MSFPTTTQTNPPPYYNKSAGDKDGMQYVRLGNTGAVVSRICLGLMSSAQLKSGETKWYDWMLTYEESEPFVKQALDSGITFFDTAEVYSDGRSEEIFGTALKKAAAAESLYRRGPHHLHQDLSCSYSARRRLRRPPEGPE